MKKVEYSDELKRELDKRYDDLRNGKEKEFLPKKVKEELKGS
ncbi:MAG TPA: hypothetical protein VGW31_00875 [Hanamia sp.]|nr:hypothetical protein [Hanamia sp.]